VQLKKTIIAYTTANTSKKCPRFTQDTFKALEQILPTLEIFLKLTKRYSTQGVNIHKVLNDMHNTIESLKKAMKSAHPARRPSFEAAIDKLMKYMLPMLKNDWLCTAFALDPKIKENGLSGIFGLKGYDMPERKEEVVRFIRGMLQKYEPEANDPVEEEDIGLDEDREDSPCEWVASQATPASSSQQDTSTDAWDEYNSRFSQQKDIDPKANESLLDYWKRQGATNLLLVPLSRVARDILSLQASSTDCERLFSHGSATLGIKRNLGAEMLLKQVCTKMWTADTGFLTLKDIEDML
jgi:hypothetical protein